MHSESLLLSGICPEAEEISQRSDLKPTREALLKILLVFERKQKPKNPSQPLQKRWPSALCPMGSCLPLTRMGPLFNLCSWPIIVSKNIGLVREK